MLSILYRLSTSPDLYTGCELAVFVMLYNTSMAVSECGMESLISTIEQSNDKAGPISLPQLHSEVNIRKNGPHPLHRTTEQFLYDSLYRLFGGGPEKWNFTRTTITTKLGPQHSIVITRLMNNAPNPKLQ